MRVVINLEDAGQAAQWRDELAARLPHADVSVDEGGIPRKPADYAVSWTPPGDFFTRHPCLRAFLSVAAGVDRLMRHPGLPPDLPVIRLEDAGMGWQIAEYCMHEVLRWRGGFDAYERQQARHEWRVCRARRREALRIGVMGVGVLGARVARAFVALGYPVEGFSRRAREVDGIRVNHGPERWPGFLVRSDVLILLAPLTPDTERIIDHAALAMLPSGAWLINVARGALVDDDALIDALDRGHLAGASLDVFRTEPLPPSHPFWSHPRIRVTPHVSGPTLVPESAAQVADKIQRLARGEAVSGRVDRRDGY